MSSITTDHPLHFDNLDIDEILRFKEEEIPALDNPRFSTGENWEEVVTYLRSSGVPENAFTYKFDSDKLKKLEEVDLRRLNSLESEFVSAIQDDFKTPRVRSIDMSNIDVATVTKLINEMELENANVPTEEEIFADDEKGTSYIVSRYSRWLDPNTTRDIIEHSKSDIMQYQILTEYIVTGQASALATKQILKKMPSKIEEKLPWDTAQLSQLSHFFQESTRNLDREEIVDRILKVFTMIRDYPGAYHMSMATKLVRHVLDCVRSLKFIFERNKSGDLNPMEYYIILRWAHNCYHPEYGLGRYAELDPEKYHPMTGTKLTFEELVAYTESLRKKAFTKTVSIPRPASDTIMAIGLAS